ncbi:M23 family metallopeptidase [Accumulibacter sp.]|uniref:M23 family metallopeptidase n=1 Tax=Accumulibacter sp. TaxID=2053492 RepID=UPI0025DFD912|nr:M23 family metallopeptidase [Accumulibacter sp.]MCM8612927.1 M23 family metallopeptidase [Accumulibacter sp.]MCM8636614.1 M23 family metallopeptidase [Accumulibacter sp.]MCM8639408.1 M23 family metallopeptidase [Accumulibacter sp.]
MTGALCRLFCCLLLAGAAVFPAAAGAAGYPFSVVVEAAAGGHRLLGINRGPAPVSVRLLLADVDNVRADALLPVYAVLPPHSQALLLQVGPAVAGRPHRFSSQALHTVGSYRAQPDQHFAYRLPFAPGHRAIVSQSHDGPRLTHDTPDSEYAIDFAMPAGTPVVAARDGVVIETEFANRAGGRDRRLLAKANVVRILHADGTIASYGHLAHAGIAPVAVGETLKSGTVIGGVGATGYSDGPHLHFVVQKVVGEGTGFTTVSLPVRFLIGNPPRAGSVAYRQLLHAGELGTGSAGRAAEGDARAASGRPEDRHRYR